MSEIGLACSGSNEASRQNKIKVMPNFIVSTETFIFFQIWLIDSLTRDSWLMTHDSLTHLTYKTSVLRIVASFGGYFACRFYPLKGLFREKCRAHYDLRFPLVMRYSKRGDSEIPGNDSFPVPYLHSKWRFIFNRWCWTFCCWRLASGL